MLKTPERPIHMISRKDLNYAELKIVRTSKSPTTVIKANGEVQTHEERDVTMNKYGATCIIPKSRNGCKNSGRILTMKEFLNTETHTRVLRTNHLSSRRDEWYRANNTVFIHISRKTEFAKSVRGLKITTVPRRRRIGGVLLRVEYFGDLITADHKVLTEGYASRNNHRYAVVVQDLTIQRIQSYQCKTKTSQETEWSLQKFLGLTRKPKIIYTANVLEFDKACEGLSCNHCTSTPHCSERNGIADRAVRRIKEGTSAVLLQSGLDEKKVGGFHGMSLQSAKYSRYLV